MKKFAKVLIVVIAGLIFATAFISCGKKAECDGCGEYKSVSSYSLYGIEMDLCKECKAEMKATEKLLKSYM